MTNGRGGLAHSIPMNAPAEAGLDGAAASADLAGAKAALRRAIRLVRREVHAREAGAAALAVAERFLAEVPLPAEPVVAAYAPIRDELDPLPLLARLHAAGRRCALPVVTGRDRPLGFRAWRPEAGLVAGPFGIAEPGPEAAALIPSVVIVPLLAFDRAGRRLGYGAGFYDRTLAALRRAGPVLAVGIGYAAQEVTAVPVDALDQPLDWIVTERAAMCMALRSTASGSMASGAALSGAGMTDGMR